MNPTAATFIVTILAAAAVSGGEFVIASRGGGGVSPRAVSIVAGSDPCERLAATELRDHLRRLTGAEATIVDAGGKMPASAVVLGGGDIGEDAFRLCFSDGRLQVMGRSRGVLYGVYELLERFGGCAWYSDSFEVVPRLERLAVPDDLDDFQRPAFELRTENWTSSSPLLALRNRLNPESLGPEYGGSRFRFDPVLGKCHTFERLLPAGEWFADHPEYFSSDGVERIRFCPQLCLTNPDVLRLCVEKTLERIAVSYPKGIRYYGISQNDWGNRCRCRQCAEIDRREGSPAGSLLAFVNALAAEVEKFRPDVVIQTLAYAYTSRAPRHLVPRRNVQICFCTIGCDFSLPIARARALENRSALESLRRWSRGGRDFSLWDYSSDFFGYWNVWPDFRSRQDNFRLYRDCGVRQVLMLNHGGGTNDVWGNIRCWLQAKWMWNPDLDREKLLEKCFTDHFGPAAPAIRRCFDELHSSGRDSRRFPMGCFDSVFSSAVDDALLRRVALMHEEALRSVRGTRWERNVDLARLPLDFTLAERGAARPSLGSAAADFEQDRAAARRVVAAWGSGRVQMADDRRLSEILVRRLRELASLETPPRNGRRMLLQDFNFTGDFPVTAFEQVDDPAARDGSAIRLEGANDGSIAWFDLRLVRLDPNRLYMTRLRVRTAGASKMDVPFRAGVYNRRSRRSSTCLEPRPIGGEDSYRWYDLGAFRPQPGDFVWVGLGFPSRDDDVPVDVYVDCLEIAVVGR